MRIAHKAATAVAAVAALLLLGSSVASSATSGSTGAEETYLVLYKQQAVPTDAAARIQAAGGRLVAAYDAIGVAVARSSTSSFQVAMGSINQVEGVSRTAPYATRLEQDQASSDANGAKPGDLPNAPASDADNLSPLQWDMRQIHTPEAHAITGGSPAVLVGDIDTGIDFNHPDLKPNIDVANSVDCVGGVATPGLAAQDDNGHGTHTAGTIAAASNGIGIVGVAPNVKIAGIKSGDSAGFFFPEAVICGFMWAGSHHMDVTNNSYFADPFLFNCRNDAAQRAIWKAEQRAIRYAMNQGATVVAAEGNESEDLSHPTMDITSPDNGTPVPREVTNACVVIPVEIPGVVGVTADGHNRQSNGGYLKSFYSSYGVSSADVVAPGGDSIFGVNAEAPNGRVLSTYSSTASSPCLASRTVVDPGAPGAIWCYLQGTSMASPHAAGVAALIVSRYGHLPSGRVAALLQQTADPQSCPDTLPAGYAGFTGTQSGAIQSCQGGTGHNSWYGSGQVNALSAVTE
jgi:lantibiotic leader peptide-processing serine protease